MLFFWKDSCSGKMGSFGSKNDASLSLWISAKDFFEFWYNERGQYVHGSYTDSFSKKIFTCGKWSIFDLKMMCSHNSGSALKIIFLILQYESEN